MDAISEGLRQNIGIRGLRSCVIVCGLHRSGTSAVARLINLLGADIAGDLLPNNPDNSRGYWESRALIGVHDGLLKAVDPAHDDPFDPMPLRADWLANGAARETKDRLAALIESEFADSRVFVIKDPRISRLLPLWIELLKELGIAPVVVIPFRNPLEVAASLARRAHVSLPKALLLYFYTYLESELASRMVPRIFVRYDYLLQDWRPFARRLDQISDGLLSSPADGIAAEIDEFLTDGLYHHRFSREQMLRHAEVSADIIDIFDMMNEAAHSGDERALRSAFDRLRANAVAAGQLYRGYVSSELQSLRYELKHLRESFETSTSWRVTAPLRWLKPRIWPKAPSRHCH